MIIIRRTAYFTRGQQRKRLIRETINHLLAIGYAVKVVRRRELPRRAR